MPAPHNYHAFPNPDQSIKDRNRLETGAVNENALSRKWRPSSGSLLETALCTLSRFSLRLIDRTTGKAYSADELEEKILEEAGSVTIPSSQITDSTAAGRAILTAADAAAQRTVMEFQTEIDTSNLQVVKNIFPLPVPTYTGDGRTDAGSGLIHPDVLVLDAAWNGYTHWMCITPYPGGNNDYENPSIYASNDGITWVIPAGLTNPLKVWPGGVGFNSDGCLVMYGSTLYCVYRTTTATTTTLYERHSNDGVTWTAETAVTSDISAAPDDGISPSVLHDGSQFVMYYATRVGGASVVRRTAASINGPWSTPVAVTYSGTSSSTKPLNSSTKPIWHLQCFRLSGKVYMLAQIPPSAASADFEDGKLYLGESSDGLVFQFSETPIFSDENPLYRKDSNSIGSEWYYRSSIAPVVNGGEVMLRMWYSTEWSNLGYAEIICPTGSKISKGEPRKTLRIRSLNSAAINNSSVLIADPVLKVPIRAGIPTFVRLAVGLDASNTTTGVKVDLVPSSADVTYFKGEWVLGGASLASSIFGRQTEVEINGSSFTPSSNAASQNYEAKGDFLIITRADLTLSFSFAQLSANATNTLIRNRSWIMAEEVKF